MKMKKALAAVSAAAMCASMIGTFATSASAIAAGATSIDFEDGDYSFVYLNVYDGGTDCTLSVEDYNGSKALKVDPADYTKAPKVWFDLDKIMDRATATEIATIEMDITFVPVDPATQVGWAGGAIGAAGGFDKDNIQASQAKPSWSASDWELTDGNNYVDGAASTVHATKKFLLPSSKYSADGTNPFFCIMRWEGAAADWDMYVDNIVFKNKAGDVLSVGVAAAEETTAAPEETTAAPAEETTAAPAEETTAAPAETDAAPAETTAVAATTAAPDASATTPTPTGNVPAAAMAVVMVASAAAAVIAKRK